MAKDLQLNDPFWTSGLVSRVEEFHGRQAELDGLVANIKRSGIAISGPVGIGKSSLLSMMRLKLEGFDTPLNSVSTLAMCGTHDKPWQLARKLFRHFRKVTYRKTKERGFDLKGIIWKDTTQENDLVEDDYVTALGEILTELSGEEKFDYIGIFFDEAHKCPSALAELIRSIKEQLEHEGVSELRFLTAGIGAYMDEMVKVDSGIGRAFQNRFKLGPWDQETTIRFVEEKLQLVVEEAEEHGLDVQVRGTGDDDLPMVVYRLSGGHPFLTQLLGSYLMRHENADPDDVLDARDLVGAMTEICDRTRNPEYLEMTRILEESAMLDSFKRIIATLSDKGPARISPIDFEELFGEDARRWFVDNDFLFESSEGFRFTDELLRVSIMLNEDRAAAKVEERELFGDEFADFDDDEF